MKLRSSAILVISMLSVMSMMIGMLSMPNERTATTSGYKTPKAVMEFNNFESYTTGQTNIGVNWSYTPEGMYFGCDATISVDSSVVKNGANSLKIGAPVSAYGFMQHNLSSPQTGNATYSLWYYPESATGYPYIFSLTNYNIFATAGINTITILLTDAYGGPEVYMTDSMTTYYLVGSYTEDAWNALYIESNLSSQMVGAATSDSAMPTTPSIWCGMSAGWASPINDFIVNIGTGTSYLYIDDFKTGKTVPEITSTPSTAILGESTYYYNSTSTLNIGNTPLLNWTAKTNASWLHYPATNPNGTAYCNLSGVAANTAAKYWVNLTVNDTDSYDYQNWTVAVTPTINPVIITTPNYTVGGHEYYSYHAASTGKSLSSPSINWTVKTDLSWIHYPAISPNGTRYCNLSGYAPSYPFSGYVNLTVNDTDSYDYQNWTVTGVLTNYPTITTTPNYTAGRQEYYSYQAISTRKSPTSPSINWTVKTDLSWIHYPAISPNGTRYCNLSGYAPSYPFSGYVNLTVNDTDSYDYQNYTLQTLFDSIDTPLVTAITGKLYYYDVNITNESAYTMTMSSNASWLSFGAGNVIFGVCPAGAANHSYYVNINYTRAGSSQQKLFLIRCYDQAWGGNSGSWCPQEYPASGAGVLETWNSTYLAYTVDWNCSTYITRFYNGAWSPLVYIGISPALIGDTHIRPDLVMNASGYLHVFYGMHATDVLYSVSSYPYSINNWTAKPNIAGVYSYPSTIIAPNGTMYLFVRDGTTYPLNQDGWTYFNSSDNGTTWTAHILFDGGNPNGYAYCDGFVYDDSNPSYPTINLVFTWDNRTYSPDRRENLYYAELNLTDDHIYGFDGSDAGTSIASQLDADANCAVYLLYGYTVNYPTLIMHKGLPVVSVSVLVSGTNYTALPIFFRGTNSGTWVMMPIISMELTNYWGLPVWTQRDDNITYWQVDNSYVDRYGCGQIIWYQYNFSTSSWSPGEWIYSTGYATDPQMNIGWLAVVRKVGNASNAEKISFGELSFPVGYLNAHMFIYDKDRGFQINGSAWAFTNYTYSPIVIPTTPITPVIAPDTFSKLVDFSYYFGDNPGEVFFTDQSFMATSWYWSFGDGTHSTLKNPLHTYTSSGTYNVSMTVTSPTGAFMTVSKEITVTIPMSQVISNYAYLIVFIAAVLLLGLMCWLRWR